MVSSNRIVPDKIPSFKVSVRLLLFLRRYLVKESLAGLFPAAGGAPLVSVFDPVHLSALLGLAANPPGSAMVSWRGNTGGMWPEGGTVVLEPLFTYTD